MASPLELSPEGDLARVAWTESATALGLLLCGSGGLWTASSFVPWTGRCALACALFLRARARC